MTYHQLLYFLEKDYFLKFTSLKGQLENKGKDTKDAIIREWAKSWENVNACYLAQVGVVIRNSEEPPQFIDEHYHALNHGLRKFKPLERHPTLDIPISTEEENQENLRISAICKENLLKIREEKRIAAEGPNSASNDTSEKEVPEMVMQYEEAVRILSGGRNG